MDVAFLENTPVDRRKSPLSRLMLARSKAITGQKVNLCPHGCKTQEIDQNGYCRHLVGFTVDKKTYEPLVLIKGLRVVQVPMKATAMRELGDNGEAVPIMAPSPPECQPGDTFEQITTCFRVYRDVDADKRLTKKAS